MTDEQKALVEWLLDEAGFACERTEAGKLHEAADTIEAQAREIERLREALVGIRAVIEDMDNPFDVSASGEMHYGFETAIEHATNLINERLGETSHD